MEKLNFTEGRLFTLRKLETGVFTGRQISAAAKLEGVNTTANGSDEWADKHLIWLRSNRLAGHTGTRHEGSLVHKITKLGTRQLRLIDTPDCAAYPPGFIRDVACERQRQVCVEKRSAEIDDTYVGGELAQAASVYALLAAGQPMSVAEAFWPVSWDRSWLKHDVADPARSMVKAAALLAAEADRRQRLKIRMGDAR